MIKNFPANGMSLADTVTALELIFGKLFVWRSFILSTSKTGVVTSQVYYHDDNGSHVSFICRNGVVKSYYISFKHGESEYHSI